MEARQVTLREQVRQGTLKISRAPPRRANGPEAAGRAEMLEGSAEEISTRLVSILAERGLV